MDRVALSVGETAKALGLSRNSIYRGITCGQIPATRLGGRILIPRGFLTALASSAPTDPHEGRPRGEDD